MKREEILETLRAAALGDQVFDWANSWIWDKKFNSERSMRRLVDAVSAILADLDERKADKVAPQVEQARIPAKGGG